MMFVLQALYATQQRHNMREFSDFLTRYLGLVSNQFRESSATASRVVQGDERDSKQLAANAQRWHKIMVWLGMRPFFIESFVRNVSFQLRRNLGYYLFGAFAWFMVLLPAIIAVGFLAADATQVALPESTIAIVSAAYASGAAFALYLINRNVVMDELNQMNWLGYDNLHLAKQMDEVIGKFAEEIGLWRGRFRD
jgi:hypothetical protein